MNNLLLQNIYSCFLSQYHNKPMVFRAPGRISLIGEHTDYNEGFVLPAAIDKNMFFAIAPNASKQINVFAYDLKESFTFSVGQKTSASQWGKYFVGVSALLAARGLSSGYDCVFGGDIPLGAGLSSSAALSCGLAFGLNEVFKLDLSRKELALLAQKTEHDYVGVKCGIMDQFAVLFGEVNTCIKLDCRDTTYEYIPLELGDYTVVLFDTGVKLHWHHQNTTREGQIAKSGFIFYKRYTHRYTACVM